MSSLKLIIAAGVTAMVTSSAASAATTTGFRDGGLVEAFMTRGGQSVSTGIATLGDGRDAPVVMLADGPASGTGHLKPTKPDQSGFGSGVGLKPDPKEVIVIPMPAAAGMALAGLFLIGSTRRR